mmetsp:Transcript_61815/g.165383  ORF Transcript_61815/g.165383 Transcript_61815/m.165383 type:complete len:264 (+) Transcript_61815:1-792(+)
MQACMPSRRPHARSARVGYASARQADHFETDCRPGTRRSQSRGGSTAASAGYWPFFTSAMTSLEAPKKRRAWGAVRAIWLMMLYLATRPTRMEPRRVRLLMFESFAKKMSGCRMMGMAATGTAATLPYSCIIPSVHDHHLLLKVDGKESFTKSVPRASMRSTIRKQPRTVPTAFMHAVKNQRLGFASTAEQKRITRGPLMTRVKRLAPESTPTMMGNQGAAANCLRLSRESFQPMVWKLAHAERALRRRRERASGSQFLATMA